MDDLVAELEREDEAVVSRIAGDRPLLVAFGGLALKVGLPPFEFVRLTEQLAVDLLFVRDLTQSFYLRGIPGLGGNFPEMADSLLTWVEPAPRTVFIGNSAGGFAALTLGALCGVDQTLAFSPPTFLTRTLRLRHADRRWRSHINPVNRGSRRQAEFLDVRPTIASHPGVPAHVYYAKQLRVDRVHAERLGQLPDVHLHPMVGADHMLIRSMRNSGQLLDQLRSALG